MDKIKILIEKAHNFYSRYYEICQDNYDNMLENINQFQHMSPEELYSYIQSKSLDDKEHDFDELNLNVYYSGDYSFLDKYSSNVKNLFKILIQNNNQNLHIVTYDPSFFFSYLKTIDDLIEMYDCLYENPFLVRNPCKFKNRELKKIHQKNMLTKYKLKKLSDITERESENVVLNFIFSNRKESININRIFLTDWYFNNNFRKEDFYNFLFNFEYNQVFLNQIVGYLKSWNIDLDIDENILKMLSDFAEMHCMVDLYDLLNYEIDSKNDFYDRNILYFTENGFLLSEYQEDKVYKLVHFCEFFYIFNYQNILIRKFYHRKMPRHEFLLDIIKTDDQTEYLLNKIERRFFEINNFSL